MIKVFMLKQKLKIRRLSGRFGVAVLLAAVLLSAGTYGGLVKADQTGNQIQQLQQQNIQNQEQVDQLAAQATSYEDAVNKLEQQINDMQQQIVANQNKASDLQNQITVAQVDLDHQKEVLGISIKTMYLEGKISTLEILASSKDLSEYIDKQTYRSSVQNKVKSTLDKITLLKQQLLSQKNAVDSLLEQQQAIRSQLAADESKQSQLLAYTEGQKAAYVQQIKSNKSKIAALIAQQIRSNTSLSGGYYFLRFPGTVIPHNSSVNDYPYAGSGFSMSTAPGCNDGDGPDRWLYCTRQCVSYAAWAVERSGRRAPIGYGNAKDWVLHANSDGVSVYTSDPQPGDVAISTAGTWGHAMYVEAVSGNQIFVSEYNNFLTGQYFTEWRTYR